MLETIDVSLAIFITSMSDGKSVTFFSYRFILFSRPPDFRLAFDAAERNEKFGRIQYQRSKRELQQWKKRSIPLQKDNESRSKKQSHPNELSEN